MSGTVRDLRDLLDRNLIAPKKRWGQNFLVNREARERIVRLLEPGPSELVWEIGGGTGALTEILSARCGRLVVFEVDHGLVEILKSVLGSAAGRLVVPGDFCRTFGGVAEESGPPDRIVGNLPYRSASRIIALLAGSPLRPRRLLFTVQRELAERMGARPETKAYSSFTVLCQARFSVRAAGDLSPASFYPAPHVSSRIVLLEPREGAVDGACLEALQALTRVLFATRRKTMRRSLAADGVPRAFAAAATQGLGRLGIDTGRRPEEVTVEQFTALAALVGPAAASLGGSGEAAFPED